MAKDGGSSKSDSNDQRKPFYTTNRRRLMQAAGGLGAAGLLGSGPAGAQQSTDDNIIELEVVRRSPDPNELNFDVDGDGTVSYADVVAFFEGFDKPRIRNNAQQYDFNRNDRLDFDDVVTLFQEMDDPPSTGSAPVWLGVSPDEIDGATNPTLSLTAGETYTVEWTNTAGVESNFVIADADGNELVSSDPASEQGATQTVEFTATAEMAAYYSSANSDTQRGQIDVGAAVEEVNILVFSATAGFRHSNIPYGVEVLSGLNDRIAEATGANSVTIDTITEDASQFPTDASELAQYDVLVWFNTTGNVLDGNQQAAFETYIRNGGGYAGIHAASDTEYEWEFYGDMLGGAYFNGHPPGTYEAEIHVTDRTHPSTNHLPARWTGTDEWYGYQQNPRGEVHVLASLDERSYVTEHNQANPDDQIQSHMNHGEGVGRDHPIAWCQHYQGGRAWYTGRGHTEEVFDQENFIQHVIGGVVWAGGFEEDPATGTIWDSYDREVLVEELSEPMKMNVSADGRVFFVQRGGRVAVLDPDTGATTTLAELDVFTGQEDGLLGIALDPEFEENGWVYLYYSPMPEDVNANRLSRFTVSDGSIDLSTEVQMLDVASDRAGLNHAAGDLEFDTQGNLYITTGDNTNPFESSGYTPIDERDGRAVYDAQRSSSNTNDLRGSVLRITPQDDGTYTIPEGNLFAGDSSDRTRPEIYGMGFRNPFTAAINPATDEAWVADYGPDAGSWNAERGPPGTTEITNVDEPGFYGWPYFTGHSVPYRDYDFATEESGDLFSPANPTNDSPHNDGLTDLPAAQGTSIMLPYDWNDYLSGVPSAWEEYVPYGSVAEVPHPQLTTGGPMVGTVFEHRSGYGQGSLTAAMDGKVFIMSYNGGQWIKYVSLDDEGRVMEVDPFLPNVDWTTPFDMSVGPNGALYLIEYSSGAISRITGGGSATTAAVSLDLQTTTLAPEESTTATVTVENISETDLTDVRVSVTAENDRIQVTAPSGTSFDSLAPGESRTLQYDVAVAAEASEGSYGVAAEATFTQEGEETTVTASSAITVPLQEITAPFGYDAGGTETDGTVTINGLPFTAESPVVDVSGDGVETITTSDPITGTDADLLYQSAQQGGNLSYDVGIANGTYDVTLHFAEIHYGGNGNGGGEGSRVFDVSVEGNQAIGGLDVYAEAGHDAALTRTVEGVEVADGTLSIESTATAGTTLISGIEIRYSEALQEGLVAHLTLDDDTPTNEVSGNDASIVGGVTTGADGVVGNAYEFHTNGDIEVGGDHVVTEPLPLNGEGGTVGAWMNYTDHEDYGRVFQVGGTADEGPTDGWDVEFSGGDDAVEPQLWNDSGTGVGGGGNGIALQSGTWYFVVMVVEGGDARLHVFDRDGELDASPQVWTSGLRTRSDAEPLFVALGDGRDTAGRFDDVWAYSRSLAESEVSRLYSQSISGADDGNDGGSGDGKLEAHFPLNGDTPTNTVTGNDATIQGDVTTGAEGVVGNAYEFHTNGDIESAAGAVVTEPLPLNGEAATAGAWMNFTGHEEYARGPYQIGGTPNTFPPAGWDVEFNGTSNDITVQVSDDGSPVADVGTITLQPETWYFIVTVIDGDQASLHVFDQDGELDASPVTGSGTRTRSSAEPMILGVGDGRDIAGRIDNVWAYSRALSGDEIGQLYADASTESSGGSGGSALDPGTTIQLDGYTQAWKGTAPDAISGQSNPTLTLQEGAEYTVKWTNADGALHDFYLLDGSGAQLAGTETVSEQGATTSVTFTASAEMAEYYCSLHPNRMRGSVEIV